MNKQSRKVLLGAATLAAIMGAAEAQAATGKVDLEAKIIKAIQVVAGQELNFGTITVATGSAGTVKVADDGTRTKTGGVSLIGGLGAEQEGTFSIKAAVSQPYVVTVGATAAPFATLKAGGANTLDVTAITFITAGVNQQTLTQTGATKAYAFGGTLAVPAGHPTGTYTGQITITANYQ